MNCYYKPLKKLEQSCVERAAETVRHKDFPGNLGKQDIKGSAEMFYRCIQGKCLGGKIHLILVGFSKQNLEDLWSLRE